MLKVCSRHIIVTVTELTLLAVTLCELQHFHDFDLDYDYEQLPLTDTDVDSAIEGYFLSRPGSHSFVYVTHQLVEFLKPCVSLRSTLEAHPRTTLFPSLSPSYNYESLQSRIGLMRIVYKRM